MGTSKYVVTVTRQFGSMGRPIAKKMAEKLGIEYYDREIVDKAAAQLHLPVSTINEEEERAHTQIKSNFISMMFPFGAVGSESVSVPSARDETRDRIFEAQKDIIQFLAEKDTCVIVGRCADFVLSDMKNVVNIYIYASYDARLRHCIEDLGMDKEEAEKMISAVDAARDEYHMRYAGYHADDKRFKDIMIDSSFLGVDGTADYLAEAIRQKFQS